MRLLACTICLFVRLRLVVCAFVSLYDLLACTFTFVVCTFVSLYDLLTCTFGCLCVC